MKQKIADRIRTIRTLKRLTQENVADEIGITHGAYAKIERGETDPNTNRLAEIAKVLKVDISEFFDDPDAKENKINYGYASKEDVESLAKMVTSLAKEIEKLRQELPKAQAGKKSKK
ncbi:MAG: helix-turn-helix domain-containing protein [Bacteroidia bacterium]